MLRHSWRQGKSTLDRVPHPNHSFALIADAHIRVHAIAASLLHLSGSAIVRTAQQHRQPLGNIPQGDPGSWWGSKKYQWILLFNVFPNLLSDGVPCQINSWIDTDVISSSSNKAGFLFLEISRIEQRSRPIDRLSYW